MTAVKPRLGTAVVRGADVGADMAQEGGWALACVTPAPTCHWQHACEARGSGSLSAGVLGTPCVCSAPHWPIRG